jgi:hypothetical protein
MPTKSKRKPKKRPPKIADPKQSSRFLEMARKLEADESGAAFEGALNKLVPKKRS